MTYLSMDDLTYVFPIDTHDTRSANIRWASGSASKDKLRSLQLDMRLQEVYETYHSFKRLVSDPSQRDGTRFDEKATSSAIDGFMASIPDRVDFDNVHLTGHSFGGGTMVSWPLLIVLGADTQLHLLQSPPPDDLPAIPVKRCIALDPWVEPLPRPTPSTSGPLPRVPILCINSPGFTEWSTHFQRLLEMVKKVDGSFLTLLGASRTSPLHAYYFV